jgi:tetratricopeptide (TPR) repeat protein
MGSAESDLPTLTAAVMGQVFLEGMGMSQQIGASTLLQKVQHRLTAVRIARKLHHWTLAAVIFAGVAVVGVRLSGLIPPGNQRLEWLALIPLVAAVAAWLFHRRVGKTDAARAVDRFAGTDDLFLTLATLSTSAGEYQPLVEQSALVVAPKIVPNQVVPFTPQKSLGMQALGWVALAGLIWFVPTLDPFGKVEAAARVEQKQKEVQQILKSVKTREEQLSREVRTGEEREQKIEEQTQELMAALRKMKPADSQPNSKVLEDQRRSMNELWKQVSSEDLRQMLSESASEMQGGERAQKMAEWLRDLQQGKSDSLQKELQKAQETMQSMLQAETPEERQKLASDLKKQLQDLKKFSSKKAGSKELEGALEQALKSLEALAANQDRKGEPNGDEQGSESEMSEQARQALQEALELSRKELEEVARSAGDLKKLEEALKTLQQADKLNQQGQMDGEECEGCQSMAEYAEKFRSMMSGNGQNGEARRDTPGGMMTEDDSDPEGYKDEKSRSQIQAGKVLLSIRTREAATQKDFNPEDLRKYESSVREIKSGVQAAIEAEDIPPGYVDGIRQYFDKLEPSAAQP